MTNNQLIKKAEKIALLQYRNYTKNFQISIRDIFMNNRITPYKVYNNNNPIKV